MNEWPERQRKPFPLELVCLIVFTICVAVVVALVIWTA